MTTPGCGFVSFVTHFVRQFCVLESHINGSNVVRRATMHTWSLYVVVGKVRRPLLAGAGPSTRCGPHERQAQAHRARRHGRGVDAPLWRLGLQPPMFRLRPDVHDNDPVCPGYAARFGVAAMCLRKPEDPVRNGPRLALRRPVHGCRSSKFQAWSCETNVCASTPLDTAA